MKPSLYLTFDDGPHEDNTPAILDILGEQQAHATFFQEGRFIDIHPEITTRVAQEGHTVANHTQRHVERLPDQEPDFIRDELASTSDAIERATGRRPSLFRPPW